MKILNNLVQTTITLLLAILLTTTSNAQYTFTNYDTLNSSLAGNLVQAIAIDTEGNKWFGTKEGVNKFDGTNWTSYTTSEGLANNYVRAIAIDTEGNKWFGTNEGVSKFDGTNWTTYTTSDGLADNWVIAIAIDSAGNKWFGTEGGVSKFDGTNWTTYTTADGLADNDVRAIAIDNEGNKWFGTDGGGVSKFDNTNWTTYTTSDGLANNSIHAIAIDNAGNKWFVTYGGGVSKFDGTNWTTYTTSDGLVYDYIRAIAIDNNGDKWFGTNRGVSQMSCEAPVVDFNITGNLCEGNVIQFNNNSTKTDVFTNYEWDINNDGSVEYTTENIEHSFNAGDYTVKLTASNENCTDSCIKDITINPLPNAAGTITGNTSTCQSETNVTYTIPTIENADSYIWTLPTGATGSSTTNSITIDYGLNAVSGNITVKGHNDCGDGTEASLAITVNPLPNAASTISGNTTVCKGDQNVTYSVPTIENADTYIWTLPTGATGSSTTIVLQ